MLDLFACIFHRNQAERSRGALEKVAQRGELFQVFLFALEPTASASVHDKTGDSHICLHLLERGLCLLKEAKDDGPTEAPFFIVVIHLQDLIKCARIDQVCWQTKNGAIIALLVTPLSRASGAWGS